MGHEDEQRIILAGTEKKSSINPRLGVILASLVLVTVVGVSPVVAMRAIGESPQNYCPFAIKVYYDANGNRWPDPQEGLRGVTVCVQQPPDTGSQQCQQTDVNGYALFETLPDPYGEFRAIVHPPVGWETDDPDFTSVCYGDWLWFRLFKGRGLWQYLPLISGQKP